MSTKLVPEKKVDVPPTGARNADPISGAAGSHPIETGIGAAAAGAAAGMAVGAFTGPIGAAVGAAVGAAAATPYYSPYYYPQPYYQTPCGPPYTQDTTNCPQPY